ncbi:hypothetical protein ACQ858_22130 [Variovorax ureilyticus]|uniref:hypothetical protein n=1 Tax=Variovorax ureilyticus TaxID=1836198 RepID=UPI003D666D97
MFDYYLMPAPDVLVAVDLKNWARSTDSLKKAQLKEEAEKSISGCANSFRTTPSTPFT